MVTYYEALLIFSIRKAIFCGMAETNDSQKINRSFVERQVSLNEIIYSKNTVAKYAFRGHAALELKARPAVRRRELCGD